MFSPTASSATVWIEPPVSRAVATAKSPSAGLPIASERQIVSGRTGCTRAAAPEGRGDWFAALGLAADELRRLAVDEAERLQLTETLADLVEQRPGSDGDRDRVGQAPAELLGHFVGERLRALGVVRAQVDVDEAPVELERELDREA